MNLVVQKDIYALILTISKQNLVFSWSCRDYSFTLFVGKISGFEQHAQTEFQLKQFELDMERASWIVETSLEWKDAKGTSIPLNYLIA